MYESQIIHLALAPLARAQNTLRLAYTGLIKYVASHMDIASTRLFYLLSTVVLIPLFPTRLVVVFAQCGWTLQWRPPARRLKWA